MKTSHIMYAIWNRLRSNDINFGFNDFDTLGNDDLSLKSHFWSKESALFKVSKQFLLVLDNHNLTRMI